MIRNSHIFPLTSLQKIALMLDTHWYSWGASQSTPDGDFAVEKVYVRSERAALTIRAELVETEMGGSSEELVSLSIQEDPAEEALAATRGLENFHFKGELIRSIAVIREVTNRFTNEMNDWRLTADRGFTFEFESGRLSICSGGDFTADFFINSSELGHPLDLPDYSYLWESTLEERFESQRSIIPIQELIGQSN